MTAILTAVPVDTAPRLQRPVRPCMVSFYFYPNYSGSAVQALNLSRHLCALGMEPFILSANLSGAPAEEVTHGIRVVRVPVIKRAPIISFWLAAARYLWRNRGNVDIIHAHGTLQHGFVSLMGRVVAKPTILKVAMADSDLAFERHGRVAGAVGRFAVSRFSRYIATTDAIGKEFAEQDLDVARVRQIPNGVDTETFAPVPDEEKQRIRAALGLPEGPIITCVAIVQARKNIDGALRMWRLAVASGAPGHLTIVGPVEQPDGPFFKSLQAFIDEHRLRNRVSFVGRHSRIAPFLNASDVFLFPSRQEGMPNAVLEAMACGLPVLVSKNAGVVNLVRDGIDGHAVDPQDETAFATRLHALLSNPVERIQMGRSARQRILDHYSLGRIAAQYANLYDELLDRQSET